MDPESAWPDLERRRHDRLLLEIPVLYAPGEGADASAAWGKRGLTRNISEGGLDLEVPELLNIGASVRLRVPTKDVWIEVPGSVIWVETGPTLGDRVHGVALGPWEGDTQGAWERFVAVTRQEVLRRPVRFAVDLPVVCLEDGSPGVVSGRIGDASTGGFLVLLPDLYPVGARLVLDLSQAVDWSEGCQVRVVRTRSTPVGAPPLYPHGCEHVDPETGRRLLPELLLWRLR